MVTYEEIAPFVNIIMLIVGPSIVFLIMRHVQTQDKTQKGSTMATFNIGVMKDEMKEFKEAYEKKEDARLLEMQRIWNKFTEIAEFIAEARYRLNKLDERNGISSIRGGVGVGGGGGGH